MTTSWCCVCTRHRWCESGAEGPGDHDGFHAHRRCARHRRDQRAAYSALINEPRPYTSKQILFKEVVVGTLIYAVVLGFFDDYTSIVEAQSYTYVFLAAILLEVLTLGAFAAKDAIIGRLRHRGTRRATALMVFGVWFVMFSSKFVFIWAIDLVFGDTVNVNGFFGIFLVVLTVTVVHRLATWVFIRLGRSSLPDEPPRTVVKPPIEGA